ncbi:MAG: hypothetical protein L0H41_14895 [Microlunatus sp.]|nr:hypothetical protein [Microlunatus sp.]MDN5771943.1 hypothetical protein [Microlunatus sp.]
MTVLAAAGLTILTVPAFLIYNGMVMLRRAEGRRPATCCPWPPGWRSPPDWRSPWRHDPWTPNPCNCCVPC